MRKLVLSGMITSMLIVPALASDIDFINVCTNTAQVQMAGRATREQAKIYCQCNEEQIVTIEKKIQAKSGITQAQVKKMYLNSASICLHKANIK